MCSKRGTKEISSYQQNSTILHTLFSIQFNYVWKLLSSEIPNNETFNSKSSDNILQIVGVMIE